MGLRLVPANLDVDQQVLVDLLNRNLPQLAHGERFSWLYKENPHGLGFSWMLIDSRKDQPIGMASVFPRILNSPGGLIRAGQVGDFAIDDAYRSLGPAIQLQKATLSPLANGSLDFCYDTPPGEKGMAPFVRMGLQPFGKMVRYAKPLRLDGKVRSWVGDNLVGRMLGEIGNQIHWAFDPFPRTKNLDVHVFDGRFGEEFLALDQRINQYSKKVCRARTPDYLNWRYRDDPLHTYEVVTITEGGELRGYCILLFEGGGAHLMDVFGAHEVLPKLLGEVIALLRKKPLSSFQVNILEESDFCPILKDLGFRFRSPGCFIVGEVSSNFPRPFLLDSKNWIMTYADTAL